MAIVATDWTVTRSINNLTEKISSPPEYEFKIIRDQITGQMDYVQVRPLNTIK